MNPTGGNTTVALVQTISRCTLAAAFAIAASLAARAQAPAMSMPMPAPPSSTTAENDMLRSYNGLKANILKSADEMPVDGYSYKPEPDMRTFARILNHVSEAQFHTCSALNATPAASLPTVPPETADKASIITALKASFAECDKAYAALTDANLLEKVSMGPLTRTRVSLAWGNVAHDDEQYSALATYLRLKGLMPPSSEK
jgi:hypothetical protein